MDIEALKSLIEAITRKRNTALKLRAQASSIGNRNTYEYESGKADAFLEILDML